MAIVYGSLMIVAITTLLSSHAETTSVCVRRDYVMIACQVERHDWLIIRFGQNCPKTPLISYYQGKMAC